MLKNITGPTLLLAAGIAFGQSVIAKTKNAPDYDIDGNLLISAEEFRKCKLDEQGISLSNIDLDGSGNISIDEMENANTALENSVMELNEVVAIYEIDSPQGLTYKNFVNECATADKNSYQSSSESWLSRSGILIRGSHETIDFGKDAVDLKKAKSANILFTENLSAESTTQTIKGAVLRPIKSASNDNFIMLPSLSINQVKTSPEPDKKDIDTVELRYGLSLRRQFQPEGPIEYLYYRLNPTFTTDTNFDDDIRSLEIQIEPVALDWGIGTSQIVWDTLDVRLRPFIHYEYGEIFDDGSGEEKPSFGRLGLKLATEIWPIKSESFKATFQYEYLAKVSGDQRDRKLFSAVTDFQLDKANHYSLQLKYTNGDSSVKLENEESLSLGIGVKF